MSLLNKASKIKRKFLLKFILIIFSFCLLVSFTSIRQINTNNEMLEYYKPKLENGSTTDLYGITINNFIKDIGEKEFLDFYTQFTKNKTISKSIVKWALHYKVPVHLCFAIAHTENTGFVVYSISSKNKNGSRDWGLFQLNDGYRRNWTRNDFFNIDRNAQEGIKTYSQSYNSFIGTKGLSFTFLGYNMGISGASRHKRIPEFREKYVNDILEYESKLNEAFNKRFLYAKR